MFSPDDTIVAIATPAGRGGIGVVRVSGPGALRVADGISERTAPLEPRHATLVRITRNSAAVDRAVLTFFPAPHSYTGEDVVEISAHGSPGAPARDRGSGDRSRARGSPSRVSSRFARSCTGASIWSRRRRCRISSTR